MSVILFIIILAVLVFVHELGHFIAAKRSGIRVDEFGIGFPPRLFSWRRGETLYSFNLIPFGGFVKIFGENPNKDSTSGPDSARSITNKPKGIQILVLISGILGNFIFAWLLISLGFLIGLPASALDYDGPGKVTQERLLITYIKEDSPAQKADLKRGDEIIKIISPDNKVIEKPWVEETRELIDQSGGKEIEFVIRRKGGTETIKLSPESGIVSGKYAIGATLDMVGVLKLQAWQSFIYGAKQTVIMTGEVSVGLAEFIANAFRLKADLSQVTGPVGIAGMVGEASDLGIRYLIFFTALISIHLAVINIIPFPALDGGRIMFVIIEKIRGKPISHNIFNILNGVGFLLLIILMIVITFRDVIKLF